MVVQTLSDAELHRRSHCRKGDGPWRYEEDYFGSP